MGTTCPHIINRWLSTYKVTKWFKIHRPKLFVHIESKHPASTPPWLQWSYFLAMDDFTSCITITFRKIQRLTTLVAQQQAKLNALVNFFINDIGMSGLFTIKSIQHLDQTTHVFNRYYVVSLLNVQKFLVDLASWVEGIINEIDEVKQNELQCDVGFDFVVACVHIDSIQFQHDGNNNMFVNMYVLLLVLPHELLNMMTFNLMHQHGCQLQHCQSFGQINLITDEHTALIQAY